MARKRFELIFPDKSKKHIGTTERDRLLASQEILQQSPLQFLFIGALTAKLKTVGHTMRDIGKVAIGTPQEVEHGPKYLAGVFVVQFKDRRVREMMETPFGLHVRLASKGVLTARTATIEARNG